MKMLIKGSRKTKVNSVKTKVGLWLDHREAVIVFISAQEELIKKIQSSAEKHTGRINGVRSTASYPAQQVPADDRRQSFFTGHLNNYYEEIITCIGDADSILIFGPGEAKGELKKRIEKIKPNDRICAVESADKMTDRQITSKVREYFQEAQSH